MVKSINYIIRADKTQYIVSLPVMLLAQLCELSVLGRVIQCRFYNAKLVKNTYDKSKNNSYFEYI
jgi:hypothetical protein